MITSRFTRPLIATVAVISLAACSGTTEDASAGDAAEAGESDPIELRQANFEAIGDDFKAIRAQLESDAPDFAAIQAAAEGINTKAALIPDYFPEGTSVDSGADTEALATIWEKPEEFAAAQAKLVETSAALVAAAGTGEMAAVGEAVKAMGGSCKGCHDNFRLDTD